MPAPRDSVSDAWPLRNNRCVTITVPLGTPGTLTCNKMEFFKCSVAGVKYGRGVTEIERTMAARRRQGAVRGAALGHRCSGARLQLRRPVRAATMLSPSTTCRLRKGSHDRLKCTALEDMCMEGALSDQQWLWCLSSIELATLTRITASKHLRCRRLMGGAWQHKTDAGVIREFLKLLAVCHTVIPEGARPSRRPSSTRRAVRARRPKVTMR